MKLFPQLPSKIFWVLYYRNEAELPGPFVQDVQDIMIHGFGYHLYVKELVYLEDETITCFKNAD